MNLSLTKLSRWLPALVCAFGTVRAAPAHPARAGEWPQFRGPDGGGVAGDELPLPAALERERNLLWRSPVGAGHSSPVVFGERVFLTSATDEELAVLCLDRRTGEPRWRAALAPAGPERTHEVNSAASPTPAADGESVYAYFGAFGLVCYDHEGHERWRRPLPVPENSFGAAASPILAAGLLIFNLDSEAGGWVEVLEPSTGETVWRKEREGDKAGWSTPSAWRRDGVAELLVYAPRRLVAYDLATGAERWSAPGLTDEPCTTPITGGGLVYVTSYNMKTSPEVLGLPAWAALAAELDRDADGTLDREEAARNVSVLSRHDAEGEGDHPLLMFFRYLDVDADGEISEAEYQKLVAWVDSWDFANALLAIRPGDGERPAEVAWQHSRGVPECPSPLFHGGRVYMVKNGGLLSCLDATSGELRYHARLDAPGPCYASPVAGDGKIYTASAGGVVTALAAGDELRVLARSDLGERIMATPALAGGRVYVRTAEALYAFGSPDGE